MEADRTSGRSSRKAAKAKGIRTAAVKHQMQRFQNHCTHLTIIPRNVRISHYLRKHRAQRRSAECAVATTGELELLTKGDEEVRGLLRRRERQGLGDLKGSNTERATAVRDDGVRNQPFKLILSVFQERLVRDTRWEGVGILSIILHQKMRKAQKMLYRALTYLGYVFRVSELGRIYFVLDRGIHQGIDCFTKKMHIYARAPGPRSRAEVGPKWR